jgi:hypothetical protein
LTEIKKPDLSAIDRVVLEQFNRDGTTRYSDITFGLKWMSRRALSGKLVTLIDHGMVDVLGDNLFCLTDAGRAEVSK